MIVYKTTDRIPLKLGDITIWVSPLSAYQKADILSTMKMQGGVEVADGPKMALLTIKHSVKRLTGLNGIKFFDGSEVTLTFDKNESLDEESLNTLMQVINYSKLTDIAAQLLISNIDELKIEGVKVGNLVVEDSKKKA